MKKNTTTGARGYKKAQSTTPELIARAGLWIKSD
ncbi:MAG: hypothetical protein ACJASP_002057 [Roseivirga sp.]|jgi:hypothetical protein